ncbi:hypothetical protein BN2497_5477 [Janthinobacterium sp. CG23_2]|nr:hypothetical protein BN2497_5477 [Janthinobacterium sp. CG23_2]CUU29136.1 hypothetical protein BN3177_5477 [Janthinobacterium sp. CG23_2]
MRDGSGRMVVHGDCNSLRVGRAGAARLPWRRRCRGMRRWRLPGCACRPGQDGLCPGSPLPHYDDGPDETVRIIQYFLRSKRGKPVAAMAPSSAPACAVPPGSG